MTDKKTLMKEKVAQALGLEVEDIENESILQIALTYNQIVYNEALQREQQRQQMNQQKNAAIKQSGVLVDPYGKKR